MVKFISIFTCFFLLFGCRPEPASPNFLLRDLTINQTTSPASGTRLQPININVEMTGPDQCYRFSHFEVLKPSTLVYDIRAKATYPNPDRGPVSCNPPAYTKDTVLTIQTTVMGAHVFRFFNGPVLFKTDTVHVN